MRRLLCTVIALAACRAAPLPEPERYPSGTPFRALERVVDGTRLRIIDTGAGIPVVFVHGFGASLYAWRRSLGPLAAAGYRVVAFDNRGFGFSGKPARGYANADYARLVVALMDSLRLPDAVLVGHSMGGAIAADVALAHPARVRALVLIGSAGFGIRTPVVLKLARWPLVGPLATSLRGRWITARILRSTYADPDKVTERDVDQYYAPVPDPDYGRALHAVLREFRFDALQGRLSAVRAPTLVLWGERDRWIPPAIGSRLAAELLRAAFLIVPGAGHAAPEEAPDAVNRFVIAFLEEALPRIPEDLAWSPPSSPSSPSGRRSTPNLRPALAPRRRPGGRARRPLNFINRLVDENWIVHPKLRNTRALRILAAAREEFSKRGFDGARVDAIARRAGVNKQLLFYYYHSKHELFHAVLAQAAAELGQALEDLGVPPGRPIERIRQALGIQFEFLARHPDLVTLLTQAGRADSGPFAPAIKRLVVLFAEGQGLGQVRDDVDPHLAAAQSLVLMVGYLKLESLLAASAPPLGADEPTLRERWKEAAVDLVVEGVRVG